MSRWLPYIGVALLSGAVAAIGTTLLTDRAADAGLRAYLLDHPEVIPEAMEKLRMKQVAAQIEPHRRELETPYAGGWIGAAQPDVTLVQFFDYACGYCRTSLPDLQRLVRDDPKLRVVFRELPILSADSEAAARASLAAAEQGRYAAFHEAMYAAGRPIDAGIAAAARASGLDPMKLRTANADREIARNLELARTLGFTGTPSWVVGNQVMSGAVGYDALKKAVSEARART